MESEKLEKVIQKRMMWAGEVVYDSFMEWLDYNERFGLDFDLDKAHRVPNYKWECTPDEGLLERDRWSL